MLIVLGALVVLALSAAPAGAATVDVHVGYLGGDQFYLPNVTINQGDTIHWIWDSVPAFSGHSVTSGPVSSAPTGDGGFDSGVHTTAGATFDHTFSTPGTLRYFCKVHYAFGMVGTITVLAPDTAPQASFTFGPGHPLAGQMVTFDASASSDGDGDTVGSYRWDWGDGSAATTTSSATTTHVYAGPGAFTATLTVTDSRSTPSAPTTETINVGGETPTPKPPTPPTPPAPTTPTPPTRPVPRITKPHASFCAKRGCERRGASVTFTLSAPERIVVTVAPTGHRKRVLERLRFAGKAGHNALSLGLATLPPGRYVVTLRPSTGAATSLGFTVPG